MPPKEKLTAKQIEYFEQWVKIGAPRSAVRGGHGAAQAAEGPDLIAGRKWWAFQPVTELPATPVKEPAWVKKKLDAFVLQKLETAKISPSPQRRSTHSDRTRLSRFDRPASHLRTGRSLRQRTIRQTFRANRRAFAGLPSIWPALGPLLARRRPLRRRQPHQRSHEPTLSIRLAISRLGHPGHQSGRAVRPVHNLAARRRPDAPGRSDLAATGFSGIGPSYHKDGRLSKDVIENLCLDDWDERVDVVSEAFSA